MATDAERREQKVEAARREAAGEVERSDSMLAALTEERRGLQQRADDGDEQAKRRLGQVDEQIKSREKAAQERKADAEKRAGDGEAAAQEPAGRSARPKSTS